MHLTTEAMKKIDQVFIRQPTYVTPQDWRWTGSRARVGLLDGVKDKRGFEPVSRGYFKMQQIINHLPDNLSDVLCLCQGSGGFVQAILQRHPQAYINAGSLTNVQPNLQHPHLRKIISGTNVSIINVDKGDVFSKFFIATVGQYKYDLITMDAAEMTKNYGKRQERHNAFFRILQNDYFSMLKVGGSIVFKFFGITLEKTFQHIKKISNSFAHLRVVKPQFSNCLSSQLYIIATGYLQGTSFVPLQQIMCHMNNLKYNWNNRNSALRLTPKQIRHLKTLYSSEHLYRNYIKRLSVSDNVKRDHVQFMLSNIKQDGFLFRKGEREQLQKKQRQRKQHNDIRKKTVVFIKKQNLQSDHDVQQEKKVVEVKPKLPIMTTIQNKKKKYIPKVRQLDSISNKKSLKQVKKWVQKRQVELAPQKFIPLNPDTLNKQIQNGNPPFVQIGKPFVQQENPDSWWEDDHPDHQGGSHDQMRRINDSSQDQSHQQQQSTHQLIKSPPGRVRRQRRYSQDED